MHERRSLRLRLLSKLLKGFNLQSADFASADHEAALQAIIKGLAAHDPSHPGFLIHTSGTGILMLEDYMAGRFGDASDKIYDDIKDLAEVTSLPDQSPHRVTDKMVIAAGTEHSEQIKTAIVCPPTIYGVGRGPGNQRSIQVPDLIKGILQKGHGFKVNTGKTRWSNVHVFDLSDLYLKLVENGAAGGSLAEWPGKPAIWGAEAYFFSENGEHVWGEVSQEIASEAYKQGFLKSDEVKSFTAEEAGAVRQHGQALWGCNSRSRATRAREALKWKPSAPSIEDEMKGAVESEAKDLGLKPGHAAVAAGEA